MMTRPTMGLSLSSPWHLVHTFGWPWALLGSVSRVILPKILPPWSYSSTWDTTLPDFSSTVFHGPMTGSAASSVSTPTSTLTRTPATTHLIARSSGEGVDVRSLYPTAPGEAPTRSALRPVELAGQTPRLGQLGRHVHQGARVGPRRIARAAVAADRGQRDEHVGVAGMARVRGLEDGQRTVAGPGRVQRHCLHVGVPHAVGGQLGGLAQLGHRLLRRAPPGQQETEGVMERRPTRHARDPLPEHLLAPRVVVQPAVVVGEVHVGGDEGGIERDRALVGALRVVRRAAPVGQHAEAHLGLRTIGIDLLRVPVLAEAALPRGPLLRGQAL